MIQKILFLFDCLITSVYDSERLKTVCRLYHDVDVSNVEKDSYTCVGSNIVYRNSFTKVCMYCRNKTFLITFLVCDPGRGAETIHISTLISRAFNGNGSRTPEKKTRIYFANVIILFVLRYLCISLVMQALSEE